jgi:N-ethylmaleimide reductase
MQLFEKVKLGNYNLTNRMVLAPMTRARAGVTRVPNELMAEYYTQRSDAGLLITEATSISVQGLGWNDSPGIYTQEQVDGWKLTTNSVHKNGGKIFLQLWHCGRASHTSFHPEEGLSVAPSAIKLNGEYIHTPEGKQDYETPRELSVDEIKQIVNDYKEASKKAIEAGFDGVEIHAANGYLIDTFLQSRTNHREDEYGGSKEKRSKFLLDIVEAVKEVWEPGQIGVRISPNGLFNDMGSNDYREQFLFLAQKLDPHALAYLHVMDGLTFGFHELGDPMKLAEFKEVFHSSIIGNCGYTKDLAEQRIETGEADLVAFGRPYISNPDLVTRFKENLELNPDADISTWYTNQGAKGYTDFPTVSLSK